MKRLLGVISSLTGLSEEQVRVCLEPIPLSDTKPAANAQASARPPATPIAPIQASGMGSAPAGN